MITIRCPRCEYEYAIGDCIFEIVEMENGRYVNVLCPKDRFVICSKIVEKEK